MAHRKRFPGSDPFDYGDVLYERQIKLMIKLNNPFRLTSQAFSRRRKGNSYNYNSNPPNGNGAPRIRKHRSHTRQPSADQNPNPHSKQSNCISFYASVIRWLFTVHPRPTASAGVPSPICIYSRIQICIHMHLKYVV